MRCKLCIAVLAVALVMSVFSILCSAQSQKVVCEDGFGRFETSFVTGVSVTVGAARTGALAKRSCSASLSWEGHELAVADDVSQVDIDVLGADLGLRSRRVVAFQVKKSNADWDMTYLIYSLEKPPKLLYSISGGDFFNAEDTRLEGKIVIWTGDVAAVRGLDSMVIGEFDFAPTMALRFEGNKLIDVSPEYSWRFDDQIARVRAQLNADDLNEFRSSDGRLASNVAADADRMHRLRGAKVKILEIVWSYLYSGREQDAWRALDEMWPAADRDRIRIAISEARSHGIRSQTSSTSSRKSRSRSEKQVYIYDALTEPPPSKVELSHVDMRPQSILLWRPPPVDAQMRLSHSEQELELLVDKAGKVHSVTPRGEVDADVVAAAMEWKFIPAFKVGRAVPSHFLIEVSNYR